MIRKKHNHKQQTNPWHPEEEPHNNHKRPGRQSKATSSFFPEKMFSWPLNASQKYCRMLQREHSAILSTFIKLPVVIKTFVLYIFEWPSYTGFTVISQYGQVFAPLLFANFYRAETHDFLSACNYYANACICFHFLVFFYLFLSWKY